MSKENLAGIVKRVVESSTEKQVTAASQDALFTFIAHIGEVDRKLKLLSKWADNHGDVDPEDVTWSHAGTIGHVSDLISEVLEFLNIK